MWFSFLKSRNSYRSTCPMDKISKLRDIYGLFYTKFKLGGLTPLFEKCHIAQIITVANVKGIVMAQ